MPPVLLAQNISVARDSRRVVFLENLSLAKGDALWLSAPSGGGKSTLLLALARLLACEGTLELEGSLAVSLRPHKWRRAVSLLAHPPVHLGEDIRSDLLSPFQLSVRAGSTPPADDEMTRMLTGLGLGDFPLDHPMSQLSRGELARVALARTLLAGPKVLLLDEPSANLDEKTRELVADRVREFTRNGGVAIIAAHEPPWEFVSRRMSIKDGVVVEGM